MNNTNNIQKFYAVKKGNKPGIYKSWLECKNAVDGYKGPIYRKFNSEEDATIFLNNTTTQANTNAQSNITVNNNICKISDEDMKKINTMATHIQSNEYSDNINYNVNLWTCIDNDIYIFTDGSSRNITKNINKNKINSGIGIYLGLQCVNIKEQYIDKTNNQCELIAMDYAFRLIVRYHRELSELVSNGKTIKIVSDSEYCIKSCSTWLSQWKKNNWQTSSGYCVKNKSLIENIDASMTRIKLINNNLDDTHKLKVSLIHINSHQNPNTQNTGKFNMWFGNHIADLLATNKL